MNNFEKFNKIREKVTRKSDVLTNVSEVTGNSGFRCLHVLWLYPDVMNIHGGRGDIMAMLHISNLLGIPVEIRRVDRMAEEIDWEWPHIIYMTAGELKCVPDIIAALKKQANGIKSFVERHGFMIANGSSGAVFADSIKFCDGRTVNGLSLLNMIWKERETVWGDDIWIKTPQGIELIGNQIQVADVELMEGQAALGEIIYGRGNDGEGCEGARSDNIIYTGVLGPLLTKNPEFTAYILKNAAIDADIDVSGELNKQNIAMELRSAEYIKKFCETKIKKS